MKNFIKISLVTLALLLASNVSAQLLPISMGIKGGVNTSTLSSDESTKSKAGFNAGVTVDLNLPANLAIMSGLEVTTKGAKFKHADGSVNAMYLQLPVHLGYRIKLVPGVRMHFDLGPYFAQGIGGKSKLTVDGKTNKVNTFGDDGWKKFDWGLGAGVGVTFLGKLQVRAGYDFGLANVSRGDAGKIKNRNAYLSAGLLFF